jgi:hypothetical protein
MAKLLEQACADLAARGQSNAAALTAERLRYGRDDAEIDEDSSHAKVVCDRHLRILPSVPV